MQFKRGFQNSGSRVVLAACIAAAAVVTIFMISSAARSESGPAQQQDVIRLESRLTQLEQRLYTLDTSVRTLEQQSRIASGTLRSANAEDLSRLQVEVQLLQHRLAEHECALAKLDERTLTPARRKSGASSGDPCRVNFEAPVRLSDSR